MEESSKKTVPTRAQTGRGEVAWERLSSRHNPTLTAFSKLSDRKHRETAGLFRFDGIKLAGEAVGRELPLAALLFRESDAETVLCRVENTAGRAVPRDVRLLLLPDGLFAALCEESAPEGVMGVCRLPLPLHTEKVNAAAWATLSHLVLLESVRDPSNLGAIIRSAAALDVGGLLLSRDCADLYSAKTVRASMGTLFCQPIGRTDDLPGTIRALRAQGRRVFAAALDAKAASLGSFPLLPRDCVVIGNEGHGLSDATIAACDATVYIPMSARAESFNAAVAASILMWELCADGRARQE